MQFEFDIKNKKTSPERVMLNYFNYFVCHPSTRPAQLIA